MICACYDYESSAESGEQEEETITAMRTIREKIMAAK